MDNPVHFFYKHMATLLSDHGYNDVLRYFLITPTKFQVDCMPFV